MATYLSHRKILLEGRNIAKQKTVKTLYDDDDLYREIRGYFDEFREYRTVKSSKLNEEEATQTQFVVEYAITMQKPAIKYHLVRHKVLF